MATKMTKIYYQIITYIFYISLISTAYIKFGILGWYLFGTKSCIVLFAYCKKNQPTCQHFTLFGGKSKKASLWSCFSVEHAPAVNLGSKGSLVCDFWSGIKNERASTSRVPCYAIKYQMTLNIFLSKVLDKLLMNADNSHLQ